MKKTILLLFLFVTSLLSAQDITGTWHGALSIQGRQMRLDINVTKTTEGYTSTMDSPDEGVKGIPVTATSFKDNVFTFSISQIGLMYTGTFSGDVIKGKLSQNGMTFPMDLTRGTATATKVVRPQEPVKPYPYHEEEVTFKNEKGNITLAGTLTLPKKEGNYPAVILISGSHAQNRDEELLGHKPFLVLSDYLTRNGFAVLRFDDRGVGGSGGDFEKATLSDFVTDAEAAFNYLVGRKEINKKKIGYIGHSEGGTVAPLVASTNSNVAFIITLAGPGVAGTEQMVLQNYLIGKNNGLPEEDLTTLGKITRNLYNIAIAENDDKERKKAVYEYLNKEMRPFFKSKGVPDEDISKNIEMQATQISSAPYVAMLKYDPAVVFNKVKCPILALNGDKDIQVASGPSLDGIRRAAEKGGNKKVTAKELQGHNHLFQECKTCTIAEYGELEQTISPTTLNEINVWLQKNIR